MLLDLLVAIGLAEIAITVILTAASYPELPERVPMHIGLTGKIDGRGPRPVIWLLVGVEIVIALTAAQTLWLFARTEGPRATLGMAAFLDLMILLVLRAQMLLLAAARSGQERVSMASFWVFFVATMSCAVGVATLMGSG